MIANVLLWIPVPNDERQQDQGSGAKDLRVTSKFKRSPELLHIFHTVVSNMNASFPSIFVIYTLLPSRNKSSCFKCCLDTSVFTGNDTGSRDATFRIVKLPSEKRSTLKGKNLLPAGANSFPL